MAKNQAEDLGKLPVGKLLFKQAVPAAVGFMVMSINMVVDTFFVGNKIGDDGIGAISTVMPVIFLIAAFGMAIGNGGSSIVSRALGANDEERASYAFNNQITITIIINVILFVVIFLLKEPLLTLFGAVGTLRPYAKEYLDLLLMGVPFLSWAMMANSNLRAEGKPRVAMMVLLAPALVNVLLDYILIDYLDLKMTGAGWATIVSYTASALISIIYYGFNFGELKIKFAHMRLKWDTVKEILSLGSINLIRQGVITVLAVLVNMQLLENAITEGVTGEEGISIYGISSRIAMFAFFPLIGVAQGFVPIAGYNYGAQKYDRVRQAVKLSLIWGTALAVLVCGLILLNSENMAYLFLQDPEPRIVKVIDKSVSLIFLATPLVIFQMIGASYYQALGRALPAMMLTLTKQGFFLIPLILILPRFFNLDGVWYSFAIADTLTAIVCVFFLMLGLRKLPRS